MSEEELLPPPPYIGIRPPSDITKRKLEDLVYGFPLSHEWFRQRYEALKELGDELREESTEFISTARMLVKMCRQIWPPGKRKIDTLLVETSGYSEGSAIFLMIGAAGNRPPDDVVEKMEEALADYGVIEVPGWYPRTGD